jgi:beta-phosphoglucomutase-like phosphatase (HAD superfamily)
LAHEVIAIEDTPVSISAAMAAGIAVIATPGAMTDDQDFAGAAVTVDDLAAVTLAQLNAIISKET